MSPSWDQTGVPIHFHSSTISGSVSWMSLRTFASVLPRQSPSVLIFSSIAADAEVIGVGLSWDVQRLGCLAAPERGLNRTPPEEVRDPPEDGRADGPAPR